MNLKDHLTYLKSLTDINDIFNYLNQEVSFFGDNIIKGYLLEEFLVYLYRKKGFNAERVGGKNDNGIDIIITDKDNNKRFIQIKNMKNRLSFDDIIKEKNKTKDSTFDINTFEIFSLNGFTKEALNKINNSFIKLYDKNHIQELLSLKDSSNIIGPSPYNNLKNYQEIALRTMILQLTNDSRSLVILPTGTGKMYIMVGLAIAYKNMGKKILVLSPSHILNEKMQEINSYVKASDNLIYSTYHNLHNLKNLEVDLIICDEAHRIGAETWFDNLQEIIINNKDVHISGFTATPERQFSFTQKYVFTNEKPLKFNKLKFNELETYGRTTIIDFFYSNLAADLNLYDAIYLGYLKKPKLIKGIYSYEEDINKFEKEYEEYEQENVEDFKKEILSLKDNFLKESNMVDIFRKYLSPNIKKGIVFYENIKHLKEMSPAVYSWIFKSNIYNFEGIRHFTIHSKEDSKRQEIKLKKFSSEDILSDFSLMHSVDKFNEGFHINNVNMVLLLRKTLSKRIYFQQIGRALSSNSDQESIIFDIVNNTSLLSLESFDSGLLKSKEKFSNICKTFNYKNNFKGVNIEVIDSHEDFLESIKVLKERFFRVRPVVREYVKWCKENGIPNAKCTYKLKHNKGLIYNWRQYNRLLSFKRNIFSNEEKELILSVDNTFFIETQELIEQRFEGRVEEIISFIKKFNDHPKTHLTRVYNEGALAKWIGDIRSGNKKNLTETQKKELEDNGIFLLKIRTEKKTYKDYLEGIYECIKINKKFIEHKTERDYYYMLSNINSGTLKCNNEEKEYIKKLFRIGNLYNNRKNEKEQIKRHYRNIEILFSNFNDKNRVASDLNLDISKSKAWFGKALREKRFSAIIILKRLYEKKISFFSHKEVFELIDKYSFYNFKFNDFYNIFYILQHYKEFRRQVFIGEDVGIYRFITNHYFVEGTSLNLILRDLFREKNIVIYDFRKTKLTASKISLDIIFKIDKIAKNFKNKHTLSNEDIRFLNYYLENEFIENSTNWIYQDIIQRHVDIVSFIKELEKEKIKELEKEKILDFDSIKEYIDQNFNDNKMKEILINVLNEKKIPDNKTYRNFIERARRGFFLKHTGVYEKFVSLLSKLLGIDLKLELTFQQINYILEIEKIIKIDQRQIVKEDKIFNFYQSLIKNKIYSSNIEVIKEILKEKEIFV